MGGADLQPRRRVRRPGRADDDGLARGGGRLHDAARPRAPDGHRPPLRPGAVGRRPGAARMEPGLLPPGRRERHRLRPHRQRQQRARAVRARRSPRSCADPKTTPEDYLLWFHHVPWDYRMPSGRTLWDELVDRYDRGVATVDEMGRTWASLQPYVDRANASPTPPITCASRARRRAGGAMPRSPTSSRSTACRCPPARAARAFARLLQVADFPRGARTMTHPP